VTRTGKSALGIATAIQIPATVALFFTSVSFSLIIGTLALQAALAIFYLWDVGRNERVPEGTERLWRWGILILGFAAEPFYFWNFIWRED
jgi:hypothetical protein